MDEHFEFNGIKFVWSRAKAQGNLKKHGITFKQAAQIFFDPFFRYVEANADEEIREAIIGMDESWNVIFVVHALITHDQIRLISARKASRTERQYYED